MRTEGQITGRKSKGSRAEALAYMPIPRINHVVQGFIPANSWTQGKKQLK